MLIMCIETLSRCGLIKETIDFEWVTTKNTLQSSEQRIRTVDYYKKRNQTKRSRTKRSVSPPLIVATWVNLNHHLVSVELHGTVIDLGPCY